jgi:hypothetical protein
MRHLFKNFLPMQQENQSIGIDQPVAKRIKIYRNRLNQMELQKKPEKTNLWGDCNERPDDKRTHRICLLRRKKREIQSAKLSHWKQENDPLRTFRFQREHKKITEGRCAIKK